MDIAEWSIEIGSGGKRKIEITRHPIGYKDNNNKLTISVEPTNYFNNV